MLAVLSFTTIRNSLHTCATVKQSCYLVDPDSCLAFRVYTFQLISLTVWYSYGIRPDYTPKLLIILLFQPKLLIQLLSF